MEQKKKKRKTESALLLYWSCIGAISKGGLRAKAGQHEDKQSHEENINVMNPSLKGIVHPKLTFHDIF